MNQRDNSKFYINLAFSCSLRMGELLGLTWDCIDISPTSIELGQASIFVEKELQRVNREAMADLDGKDIMFKFPPTFASTHTALVLKTPKTKTSVRKVFLPKTVAEMLVQRKADIEELKDLFGDEFVDFNLVFCSSNGKPIEGQVMLPFFMLAMYEKHGQPLEKIVGNILKVAVIRPKQRPYQTNNFYAVLKRQEMLDKEVYGEENENTGGVRDIDLNIEDGQFVVLCGESGCGKTTITRLINGLIPHYYEGQMAGEVWVNGEKVSEQPLYDTAAVVGSVFQNPRSQFFNVDTTSEITFGCENLGQPEKDIRERFAKTVRDFRLEKLMDRNIFHLSGGEKQKIACAGVSIMEPDVLVMDEPSSNLDAASILDLRKILAFWKSQGKTIIVSEHRLYYLRGLADRFIYLAEGQVSRDYSAAEFEQLTEQQRSNMGLRTFALERLLPPVLPQQEKTALALHNFRFAYKNEPETLHIMDCEIPTNRIVGIIGNNGAGKSTFSRCFCGLEKRCGEIVWNGRKYRPKDRLSTCYMVMQEVNHQLFTESVLDEVLISMEEENQERAEEILNRLDLLAFKDRHPMSLSGGQKQRVAIASAIASKRSILFFDEPTSGLDYKHMKEVANVLRQVRDTGITVYVITHDLELILDCCTDIVHFENGSIIDQFQMDEAGLEKIRNYFIKGVSVK